MWGIVFWIENVWNYNRKNVSVVVKIFKDNLKGKNDYLKVFDCIKFDVIYIDGVVRKRVINFISNNIEKIVFFLN